MQNPRIGAKQSWPFEPSLQSLACELRRVPQRLWDALRLTLFAQQTDDQLQVDVGDPPNVVTSALAPNASVSEIWGSASKASRTIPLATMPGAGSKRSLAPNACAIRRAISVP